MDTMGDFNPNNETLSDLGAMRRTQDRNIRQMDSDLGVHLHHSPNEQHPESLCHLSGTDGGCVGAPLLPY